MKEGGRVATPTSFSIFDSYDVNDVKSLWSKVGYDIFTGLKIASWNDCFSADLRNEIEDL